ncbi:hypothetical protein TTHERM_000348169 (macronuclear) [Tetrahymena thermophila SB210]|uniref:Uncharacterized protein n=1 Tax=Tetrahymena thermophila (strain SB210) TaxID=312017 RepID=W7XEU9_TETTS|nr:hypothetical protein TTHERM_000348169 [Tetrahymena thermophila SB210]EWS72491.1 hypothetical protein TTHERM_000348169 [Tetrahymena thermophila SB210]|eukprot:XP_012654988.1 hypothetical protein TTHERM_000348169 [Tetrahymena thermophila SB210]
MPILILPFLQEFFINKINELKIKLLFMQVNISVQQQLPFLVNQILHMSFYLVGRSQRVALRIENSLRSYQSRIMGQYCTPSHSKSFSQGLCFPLIISQFSCKKQSLSVLQKSISQLYQLEDEVQQYYAQLGTCYTFFSPYWNFEFKEEIIEANQFLKLFIFQSLEHIHSTKLISKYNKLNILNKECYKNE